MPGGSSSDSPASKPGPTTDSMMIRRVRRRRARLVAGSVVVVTADHLGRQVARRLAGGGCAIPMSSAVVGRAADSHAAPSGAEPALAGQRRRAAAARVVAEAEAGDGAV